jgi:hypothetical protein
MKTKLRHALRAAFTIEEISSLTKIDCWFLVQSKENEEPGGRKIINP